MSNIYKIDNFEVKNRVEEAFHKDNGFEGDAVRGATLAQVKSLCAKAWPQHNRGSKTVPAKSKRNGASGLQRTNRGTR